MKRFSTIFLMSLFAFTVAFAQLQSPAEYLGYELGEQWTPHYKVYNYFHHVAKNSDMVAIEDYGFTYEGRELTHVVVTSRQNHSNLEEIRLNNLKLVGFESGEVTDNTKAIVWLSYNVHGNEASCSEAAMNTIYELIANNSSWLNDVVVIIDPMLNPDGRDKYVNWNKAITGALADPDPTAREHNEPWPGGRVNHYYFDLNRDWAWQTQIESQQRTQAYLKWMPHVHVDYHEQGYNSPYYFAPAAEPFHKAITDWQREYQTMIGENNAQYFDENGWLYFTREIFDLFYPSYGDTWPTFNGAIGMTYEQAGHSRAGLAIITNQGDTLTLRDRLIHHSTTGLSTVEITAQNASRVVQEFGDYFSNTLENGSGEYKTFIVKKSSNPDNVARMMRYLLDQKISVRAAERASTVSGYNFANGQTERVNIEAGDFVISTYQPQGTLVRVLFEPRPELADSLTYDITAWEAHYAFGVDGYALTSRVAETGVSMETEPRLSPSVDRPYAYLAKWNSLDDVKFLAHILKKGVKARYSEVPFSMDGTQYPAGTLVITRNGNERLKGFDDIVKDAADLLNRDLTPVSTGFVTTGKDFGSSSINLVKAPRIGLIAGEGTGSNNVGHIWHYFDQVIEYPVTLINRDDVGYIDWSDYDVMLLPPGSYGGTFGESGIGDLQDWIRSGGTLIAVGGANGFLARQEGFNLTRKSSDNGEESMEDRLRKYSDSDRSFIPNLSVGAVYELSMDNTHPLAFGYDETYMSLKLGSTSYEYLENGWNVGVAKDGAPRSGFVGHRAQELMGESLSFGVQNMGAGAVVYMVDDPFFRGFWHNGKLLIGNAVFFVGN
ncbi:MAG: zinc carboxypeptidase [Balneola sp.]|nr:MAG: zinc carboxypeptidase [Balneola sp.]